MATVTKKLINWRGRQTGLTIGGIYEINPDGFFIDDFGDRRFISNGDWENVEESRIIPFEEVLEMLNLLEKGGEDMDKAPNVKSALDHQEGGDHYKLPIQPIEYITKNGLGFCEGNVVKYITRWRNKNGLQDLLKVKHYVDLLIELEGLKPEGDGEGEAA